MTEYRVYATVVGPGGSALMWKCEIPRDEDLMYEGAAVSLFHVPLDDAVDRMLGALGEVTDDRIYFTELAPESEKIKSLEKEIWVRRKMIGDFEMEHSEPEGDLDLMIERDRHYKELARCEKEYREDTFLDKDEGADIRDKRMWDILRERVKRSDKYRMRGEL